MLGAQAGQGLGGQKRHVRVGHDDGAGKRRDGIHAVAHGIAGAVLLFLHGGEDVAVELGGDIVNRGRDLVALVADHGHEVFRLKPVRRVQAVAQKSAAADGVQSLLLRRLHACPRAGGEDHDRAGLCGFHVILLLNLAE